MVPALKESDRAQRRALPGKAADQAIAHVRESLAGSFFVLVTVVGDRIDAHGWDCGRHDIQRAGPRTADVNIGIHGLLRCVDAHLHDSCPGRAAGAREGRAQARLHQAHRHGAARHRLRDRLLRGRGPLRHARAAGELEGAARPRDHRRARRRAHARRPAARRHHRLRHQGRHRHAVLDGPERQRHHRLQRRLGDDEAACPGRGRQARASRSRPMR